ncbi:MAG: penicillin acylase family protein, partial [Chloroflexota bacterium]
MATVRRILSIVAALLIIAAIGGIYVYRDWTHGPLPQHEGSVTLSGLSAPVEVIRDSAGIPHIYAQTPQDLFFAQGYVQAQDRWWQMEFSRHTGSGTLSELIGQNEEILGIDVFIRTAGWRRAAERDYDAMSDDSREIMDAFAAGINAYIEGKSPGDLALEYSILGLTGIEFDVTPWTAVDSIVWGKVMAWDLAGNRSRELNIAELLEDERITEEMIATLYPSFPYGKKPTILSTEDLSSFEETASISSTDIVSAYVGIGEIELAGSMSIGFNVAFGHGLSVGSNNWVVSGEFTETGAPLMANDMHLSVGIPAIWYEVGLHCAPVTDACPYDVRGFALPAVPAIISGHNARIGWALTNVGPDTQDNYLIRINPQNPLEYEYNAEMRPITTYEEIIHFGDGTPSLAFTVRETHLGPIINDNSLNDDLTLSGFNTENPIALRWTTTQEISYLFDALLALNRASDWTTFRDALSMWDAPSQNFIYADVDGNIGYHMPGLMPLRTQGHDGFSPVPGWTDEYEWRGFVPFDMLPRAFNPERGYIGSANQPAAPLEYYTSIGTTLSDDVNPYF